MHTRCPHCGIATEGHLRCPLCSRSLVQVNLRRTLLWALVIEEYLLLTVFMLRFR
jgi:hypothetical protein